MTASDDLKDLLKQQGRREGQAEFLQGWKDALTLSVLPKEATEYYSAGYEACKKSVELQLNAYFVGATLSRLESCP